MLDADRLTLSFGPYRTPRFRFGNVVRDVARGEVRIAKLTGARIPWPVGRTRRAESLVQYADLVCAVRLESRQAVMHGWGVGAAAVQTTPQNGREVVGHATFTRRH
jgi:hypothetical protein